MPTNKNRRSRVMKKEAVIIINIRSNNEEDLRSVYDYLDVELGGWVGDKDYRQADIQLQYLHEKDGHGTEVEDVDSHEVKPL
jgi:hypothetical protein